MSCLLPRLPMLTSQVSLPWLPKDHLTHIHVLPMSYHPVVLLRRISAYSEMWEWDKICLACINLPGTLCMICTTDHISNNLWFHVYGLTCKCALYEKSIHMQKSLTGSAIYWSNMISGLSNINVKQRCNERNCKIISMFKFYTISIPWICI